MQQNNPKRYAEARGLDDPQAEEILRLTDEPLTDELVDEILQANDPPSQQKPKAVRVAIIDETRLKLMQFSVFVGDTALYWKVKSVFRTPQSCSYRVQLSCV